MRSASAARISASSTAAAAVMRAFCALPCRSATTRKASPASGSAASSMRAAAIGEHEPAALAARLGDAVRPGVERGAAPAIASAASLACLPRAGRGLLRQPLRPSCARRRSGARRAFALRKRDQPALEVGAVAAEAALGQQHGQHAPPRAPAPRLRRLGDHVRQPHRQRQLAHRRARLGQAPGRRRWRRARRAARAPRQAPAPAADRGRRGSPDRRRRRRRSRAAGRKGRPRGSPAA